ncbi:hypothetical protein AMJ57_02700 [Parcubacteria bacterium SG8_24]|nr:MAG: hypothetical protein AMJ57_02700 [Parcubacteria bacterium SG8_24]
MQQIIGPADIIIEAWDIFRRRLRIYAEFVVWWVILSMTQWAVVILSRTLVPDRMLRFLVITLVSIPVWLIFAAITIAVITVTAQDIRRKEPDVREALYTSFHKLLSFVWVTVLKYALALLPSLLFFGPFMAYLARPSAALGVATLAGALAGLILTVAVIIWLKFATDFVVVEDVRGTAALRDSRVLSLGRWWAVMFRIAIPFLFFLLVALFFRAVLYLVLGAMLGDPRLFFGTVADPEQITVIHSLVTSLVPQLVAGFVLPLMVAADLILWFDLRKRR